MASTLRPGLMHATGRRARSIAGASTLHELRQSLAKQAPEVGWRNAAQAVLSGHPELFQYVGDERAADWRFLLPQLPRGEALCLGGALSPVPITLARTCERVLVVSHADDVAFLKMRAAEEGCDNIELIEEGAFSARSNVEAGHFGLVAALRSAPGEVPLRWGGLGIPALVSHVQKGGSLYIEVDRPALLLPPSAIRRRLKRAGFTQVHCYWPKPTFSSCEMLLPLGDRRLQRYYLSHVFFAMSFQRRLLRRVLTLATALDLFELTLPGYMVVATHCRESRSKHVRTH